MAGVLVFSPKCKFSQEIIRYIQDSPVLQSMIQYHNVNINGIPSPKITHVPTMITKNSKFLVGKEIRAWLESLLPNDITNCTLGGCGAVGASLEGTDDDGDLFSLESYGQSLQPVLTQALQDKINKNVTDAFGNYNKD